MLPSVLGTVMAISPSTRHSLEILSLIIGWIYTMSWNLSFYPQPILNWQRKSTVGTAVDFPFLNVIGFSCYTTTQSAFLFSPLIRAQYAARHPISPEPTNRINDFVFGAHSTILSFIVISQYIKGLWGFEVSHAQRVSRPVALIATGCGLMVAAVFGLVLGHNGTSNQDPSTWAWIDVMYALGNVKLVVTVVKYIPQVIMNYQRKSTIGWSIGTILFDLVGGILSCTQLVLDSSLQNDWSGLLGNPAKLGLSNIGIFFDVIFIVQHYVLYRHHNEDLHKSKAEEEERSPLLASSSSHEGS